jgi:hypothetical protein
MGAIIAIDNQEMLGTIQVNQTSKLRPSGKWLLVYFWFQLKEKFLPSY